MIKPFSKFLRMACDVGRNAVHRTIGQSDNHEAPAVAGRGAFTLIELLVVIAIIGVLVGLLAGGIKASAENAKKRERATETKSLSSAVMTYWHDSGKPPVTLPSGTYKKSYEEDNYEVFAKLIDERQNPLGKKYIDMNQLRTADSEKHVRRMEKATDPIADPYGKFYKVTIDLQSKTATVE